MSSNFEAESRISAGEFEEAWEPDFPSSEFEAAEEPDTGSTFGGIFIRMRNLTEL
jgi:hypothetical protein